MNFYDTRFSFINSKLHFHHSCPHCKLIWYNPITNKLSIKQKNQLDIPPNYCTIREIYYNGILEGYECTNCSVIYPKICFTNFSNPTNISSISLNHFEEN